jgi:hypothetical protein
MKYFIVSVVFGMVCFISSAYAGLGADYLTDSAAKHGQALEVVADLYAQKMIEEPEKFGAKIMDLSIELRKLKLTEEEKIQLIVLERSLNKKIRIFNSDNHNFLIKFAGGTTAFFVGAAAGGYFGLRFVRIIPDFMVASGLNRVFRDGDPMAAFLVSLFAGVAAGASIVVPSIVVGFGSIYPGVKITSATLRHFNMRIDQVENLLE